MTVRMLTADLLSLLDDLVPTAADEAGVAGCAGILLHTARVEEGSEPGATNCLVGTSTNAFAVGHGWVEAGGDLAPTLLPIQYVKALRGSFGKLVTKDNKATHVVELRRDGDEVVFSEDPDLFGDGFKQRFGVASLDDFPRGVFPALATVHLTPPKDRKPVENRTDLTGKLLAPFLSIAAHRGGQLSIYRVHQALPIHIQIGTRYRGLLMPAAGWNATDSADGGGPDVGVYPADLPPIEKPEDAKPEPASV